MAKFVNYLKDSKNTYTNEKKINGLVESCGKFMSAMTDKINENIERFKKDLGTVRQSIAKIKADAISKGHEDF